MNMEDLKVALQKQKNVMKEKEEELKKEEVQLEKKEEELEKKEDELEKKEEELKKEGMVEKSRQSILRKCCLTFTARKSFTCYLGDNVHSNAQYVTSPEIKVSIIMVDVEEVIFLVKSGYDKPATVTEKEKEDFIKTSFVGEGSRISVEEVYNICSDEAFYLRM